MTKFHPQGVGRSSNKLKASRTPLRAGIVGAGVSGASCAGVLSAAGWEVDLFDKARGVGGRLATRRFDEGWATLGSQFISARREPFRSQLREWVRQGWLVPVRGKIWKGRATVSWAQAQLQNHFRPLIQPSQLVRNLLGDARLHTQTRVASIRPRTLILEGGEIRGDYDCVICSVPTPQAIPMLEALPRLRDRLTDSVQYRPIWTFLMRWEGGPDADVIQFDDDMLNTAVRQANGAGVWAVHSSHEFAETYLQASVEEAGTRAASALMGLLGLQWPVEIETAHLWKLARPSSSAGGFWLSDRENRVAIIGDGIAGAGVERAWESGTRFAQALVQAEEELAV